MLDDGMNINALKNIGLTNNEIKIYLDLLKSGSSTAYDIGKRTGIYRAHIYDKLEQLMDKGLVTHVYMGSKKIFQATGPSKIKQYLEDRRMELETQEDAINDILPQLEALVDLPKEEVSVEVFKGGEGFKEIMKDYLEVGEDMYAFGVDESKFEEKFPQVMAQLFIKEAKNKQQEFILTREEPKKIYRTKTIHYRVIPKEFFEPTPTIVYGDCVVTVIWEPFTLIRIQNKGVADSYRKHIKMLWKSAKKYYR
jgi:sugar-specific transcriptional regulator TrmB